MQEEQRFDIKAIIGLGNPGHKYALNRHNIGFLILDALGDKYNAVWEQRPNMELAPVTIHSKNILLIKPQTFMNDSGKVIPFLQKKGIKAENILVIHDELEFPFGKIRVRKGGSARGHNGLRSIIEHCGKEFIRLRFGIGRPISKDMVSKHVLSNFSETDQELEKEIYKSVDAIEELFLQDSQD
ncbi:aminoacyl-tRNA hydrolase [Candidatus Dependentiae bacterium]